MKSNLSYSPETLNSGQNRQFFCPVWPWNLTDDVEKQEGTSPMQLQALCIISWPLVNSNWSYSPETLNPGQNRQFVPRVTLKSDEWPWKTIGHFSYAASSFGHNSMAIGEFKLELQSGDAHFGSKSAMFCPVWPWNFTDDLKNNRAPLLCCFNLCASFHSHRWIQTGVTVLKRTIWVKIDIFFSCVTLKFYEWPWKTIGHIF